MQRKRAGQLKAKIATMAPTCMAPIYKVGTHFIFRCAKEVFGIWNAVSSEESVIGRSRVSV
jgi:hypothetical protein